MKTTKVKLLPYEVLEKVSKAKTPITKVKALRDNDSFALKTILQVNYRDDISFDMPEGAPPYTPDPAPAGYQIKSIDNAIKGLKNCVSSSTFPQLKKEQFFIRLLETVHAEDAKAIIAMKDKALEELYPGLSRKLVEKAYPTLQL